ncbi:hypothetical protein P9112_006078 [Eukaryota sp. TZLM1-RC]
MSLNANSTPNSPCATQPTTITFQHSTAQHKQRVRVLQNYLQEFLDDHPNFCSQQLPDCVRAVSDFCNTPSEQIQDNMLIALLETVLDASHSIVLHEKYIGDLVLIVYCISTCKGSITSADLAFLRKESFPSQTFRAALETFHICNKLLPGEFDLATITDTVKDLYCSVETKEKQHFLKMLINTILQNYSSSGGEWDCFFITDKFNLLHFLENMDETLLLTQAPLSQINKYVYAYLFVIWMKDFREYSSVKDNVLVDELHTLFFSSESFDIRSTDDFITSLCERSNLPQLYPFNVFGQAWIPDFVNLHNKLSDSDFHIWDTCNKAITHSFLSCFSEEVRRNFSDTLFRMCDQQFALPFSNETMTNTAADIQQVLGLSRLANDPKHVLSIFFRAFHHYFNSISSPSESVDTSKSLNEIARDFCGWFKSRLFFNNPESLSQHHDTNQSSNNEEAFLPLKLWDSLNFSFEHFFTTSSDCFQMPFILFGNGASRNLKSFVTSELKPLMNHYLDYCKATLQLFKEYIDLFLTIGKQLSHSDDITSFFWVFKFEKTGDSVVIKILESEVEPNAPTFVIHRLNYNEVAQRFDLLKYVHPFVKEGERLSAYLSLKSLVIILLWLQKKPVGLFLLADEKDKDHSSTVYYAMRHDKTILDRFFTKDITETSESVKKKKEDESSPDKKADKEDESLHEAILSLACDKYCSERVDRVLPGTDSFFNLNWGALYKSQATSTPMMDYYIAAEEFKFDDVGPSNIQKHIGDSLSILIILTLMDLKYYEMHNFLVNDQSNLVLDSCTLSQGIDEYEYRDGLLRWMTENPYGKIFSTIQKFKKQYLATTNYDCVLEGLVQLYTGRQCISAIPQADGTYNNAIPEAGVTSLSDRVVDDLNHDSTNSVEENTDPDSKVDPGPGVVAHLHGVVYDADSIVLYYSQDQELKIKAAREQILKNCITVGLGFFADPTFKQFLKPENSGSVDRLVIISDQSPKIGDINTSFLPKNVFWYRVCSGCYSDPLVLFVVELALRVSPWFNDFWKNFGRANRLKLLSLLLRDHQEEGATRKISDGVSLEDQSQFREYLDQPDSLVFEGYVTALLDATQLNSLDEVDKKQKELETKLDRIHGIHGKNRPLKVLQLDGNSFNDPIKLAQLLKFYSKLNEFSLASNKITHIGCKALAEALEVNSSLKRLVLDHNPIGDQGIQSLAKALKLNNSLELLILEKTNCTPTGVSALGQALKVNTKLKVLRLHDNNIGDEGVAALCDGLRINKNLGQLGLKHNNIASNGAINLANALLENNSLNGIALHSNKIDDAGVDELVRVLSQNTRIKLGLQQNIITSEKATAIKSLFGDRILI